MGSAPRRESLCVCDPAGPTPPPTPEGSPAPPSPGSLKAEPLCLSQEGLAWTVGEGRWGRGFALRSSRDTSEEGQWCGQAGGLPGRRGPGPPLQRVMKLQQTTPVRVRVSETLLTTWLAVWGLPGRLCRRATEPRSFSWVCPQAPRASPEPALSGCQGKAPAPPSRSCPGSKRDPGRDVSLEVSSAAEVLKGLRLSGTMALRGVSWGGSTGRGHPGKRCGGLLDGGAQGRRLGATEAQWDGQRGPLRNQVSLRVASPSEPRGPSQV